MSWKLGKVDTPVCHAVPELINLGQRNGGGGGMSAAADQLNST